MTVRLKVQFLVPLKYNDGKNVEQEKFFEVREKAVSLFGGVTVDPLSTEGVWKDPKTSRVYFDSCKRFEVSIEKTSEVEKILKNLKEELKKGFKQEEIYMTYHEITQV